ncbi:ionotropic receptor 25a isoform X2 [Teleopsis dalmanni]|uniref:ionotropic receptor 25a isoform X2 n=1 Tax=Teleopsis dalmanni TaxID=139649 RepID=UPI0018CD85ED|nr:ionotropic receptor 25a isoform X2 [Teleopsis dalmanni]XP_037938239.1 ionotropic receptor 25a isoform X2 [Teleopsis dalmanni]
MANNFNKFCEILSTEGVSVVLDFTYHIWQEGLELLAKQNVPYLRVDRLLSPFLQLFAEFLHQKGGNDVVLIFQNEQDKYEALLHIVDGYRFRTLLLNAGDDNEFVQRIERLRPSPSYYAIFARGTNMNNIFEKINKGNIFLRPTEWHFVFLDPRDRGFKYKKQVEFANKFTMNAKSLCRSMRMKDTYCLSGFTIQRGLLLEIFRSLTYLKQYNMDWLNPLYIDCNETEVINPYKLDLLTHLDLQYFLTFSTVPVVDNEILEEFIPPMLTYNVNVSINFYSSEHEAVTDLALWQNGELRKINETISPAKRFFRIGMTEAIPWNYYRRDPRTGKVILDRNGKPIWEGYCIDFVNTLALKLNFVYEIVEPTKGKFGKRNPKTGEWDGIVGDLVTGETDFAVTALKMYSEREEVIDYIAPYFEQTGISIVMRKPVRQTSLFKFMTVLRLEVWLSIIAALNATAVMIWLMDKYSPYSARNNKEAYPYPCREFTLRESFWFALTSFTPQGGGEAPKAVSGRILVAAYWLFVVLMLATFTANLAAFLTVERMQTPVQSLEQLARQSRINYTVVSESDTHQYFINMKFAEDTLYRMWKELSLNASEDYHKFRIWDYPIKEQYGHILLAINGSNPVVNANEGFRKVNEHENADFAFIHDSSEIKYEITHNCNLTEVGEVFAEQPYAVAVQQGSHLTDEFSFTILELQKDRYFEELKAKYWNYSLLRECALADGQGGITLESLGGVFIATLFGLGLAMVTLGVELFYYKRKHINSATKRGVIKVKPVNEDIVSEAWNENKDTNKITPPPLFEQLTFRGKTIPPNITLGDSFKPRQISKKIRQKLSGEATNEDPKLPPYVE